MKFQLQRNGLGSFVSVNSSADFEMLKWEMEILSSASYMPDSTWILNEKKNWTHEENKVFENALAFYDEDTPDRWLKVAEMVPSKTIADVMRHYKDLEDDVSHIEAGLIPIPGYGASSFKLEWINHREFDGLKSSYTSAGKRVVTRNDQERKKGIPWSEEEHRLFLLGLDTHGKGDWRNIARNFVKTRTPTQVASHAQKYFIRRQYAGVKDRRRPSIHDITTVNLSENRPLSPSKSSTLSMQSDLATAKEAPDQFPLSIDSNRQGEWGMVFSQMAPHTHGSLFVQPAYGLSFYGLLQGQNYHRGNLHESHFRPQNMVLQLQSAHHHPHG